jgi:hypothetical protein
MNYLRETICYLRGVAWYIIEFIIIGAIVVYVFNKF